MLIRIGSNGFWQPRDEPTESLKETARLFNQINAVDLDETRIREVKQATSQYPNVEAVVAEGVRYLADFSFTIDLLYLDFWTPDPEGTLPGTGRAEAYRNAFAAARDKLGDRSLILIDDTDHIHPWKHTYIIPDARKDAFDVRFVGRQTLLMRDPGGKSRA
jgi:hypothetical protein